MKLSTIFLAFVFVFCSSMTAISQEDVQPHEGGFGIDLQVYPTGIIPGIRYEFSVSAKSNIHLRAGYQIIDHGDLGVQDNEEGSGYGGSVGYKYFFDESKTKWSLMLKTDLWFNTIDWMNDGDVISSITTSGTTEITVIQPTLQLEYGFDIGGGMLLSPSLAFGIEWNVKTEGLETGQGAILLTGVALSF